MSSILGILFRATQKLFQKIPGGYQLSRTRIVKALYRYLTRKFRRKRIRIFGNIMYLDPRDDLELSFKGVHEPLTTRVFQQEVKPGDTVLEVGTGSGYQASVLSRIVSKVYTVEIIKDLGKRARDDIAALGYNNIEVSIGDGYYGLPDAAPFDAIIVTAAATHIPPPLIDQLKPGGAMCIPVGPAFQVQRLLIVEKKDDGSVTTKSIIPVRFVPLLGEH